MTFDYVKVYVWEPRGFLTSVLGSVGGIRQGTGERVGHVSMKIYKNGYLWQYKSWWPGDDGGSSNPANYQDDKNLEGGSADHKYHLTSNSVNVDNILQYWRSLRLGQVTTSSRATPGAYSFIVQNCSSAVAHALRAGNPAAQWPGHYIWTPFAVKSYCDKIVTADNNFMVSNKAR